MEMLQGVWKQHLRPRAVVGYGVKIFLPSPPNYVTRSPGCQSGCGNPELMPPEPNLPSKYSKLSVDVELRLRKAI